MLLRLEKLFRKLPRLPTSRQQFISKSNLWFFELRQLTIDAQERTRQAQLKAAPQLLYRLLTALLRNWVDRARQAGLTVAAITEQTGKGSDFSRQWQELLAQPYFRLLLPLILRQDLDWLAQHLRTLAQQLAQGGTGAVPTAINALNDELLQRQQNKLAPGFAICLHRRRRSGSMNIIDYAPTPLIFALPCMKMPIAVSWQFYGNGLSICWRDYKHYRINSRSSVNEFVNTGLVSEPAPCQESASGLLATKLICNTPYPPESERRGKIDENRLARKPSIK